MSGDDITTHSFPANWGSDNPLVVRDLTLSSWETSADVASRRGGWGGTAGGEFLELWIIVGVWVGCGLACLAVARRRGIIHVVPWVLMGSLLGPLGLILALMDARPPKTEYTLEALHRLRELREQGALSREEYEAKRSEMLGRR